MHSQNSILTAGAGHSSVPIPTENDAKLIHEGGESQHNVEERQQKVKNEVADEGMEEDEDDDEEEEESEEESESEDSGRDEKAAAALNTNGHHHQQQQNGGAVAEQYGGQPAPTCNGTTSTTTAAAVREKAPQNELQLIRANLQLLNHQMSLLMRRLNVPQCPCADCEQTLSAQQQPMVANGMPIPSNPAPNHNNNIPFNHHNASFPLQFPHQQQQQHSAAQNLIPSIELGEAAPRGRRSKYCTPEEKKSVAFYVQIHGATAAARKFNIPPAVAAYYHRKEYKKQSGAGLGSPISSNAAALQSSLLQKVNNDSSAEGEKGQQQQMEGDVKVKMEQQQQLGQHMWPASGTVGAILRGRGRGRPKLIGDELDAELVEYIVQLKQANPHAHITAAQALSIARKYITEKAPGLLEENGGQVKLKTTWAMKLVTRVQEREREIQLGLPPGSLQNLPRTALGMLDQQQQNEANNALVNELLGQNLLGGQQQIDVNALLAAANGAPGGSVGQSPMDSGDAAMLNLLGMATGNADLFGLIDQPPQSANGCVPSTSAATVVGMRQQQNGTSESEADAAIRQLLASLQGQE